MLQSILRREQSGTTRASGSHPGPPPGDRVTFGPVATKIEGVSPMPVRFFVHNQYARRHSPYKPSVDGQQEIEKIPALNKFSPDQLRAPIDGGWEPYIHPAGQRYFRSENFYTNAYLYDNANLRDIKQARTLIDAELKEHPDLASKDINIALEIYLKGEKRLACYYICDLKNKEVFWLVDCPVTFLVEDENFPVFKKENLEHAQSLAYWHHIHMFPHNRKHSKEELEELQMKGSYHLFDRKASRSSSTLHNKENLHLFRQVHPNLVNISETGCPSDYDMAKIARIHIIVSAELLRHYHGTKWVKTGWNQTVNRDSAAVNANTPSWWFTMFSWLFFFYPSLYIRRLRQLWVDYEFQDHIWEGLITDIQEDWLASITPSTVILATNVGFLAIPSVDSPGGPGAQTSERSAGQIISYISTLLSIGNIIACAILSWQHRGMSQLSADYIAPYCHLQYAAKSWKIELLAIVLSIPIVFFIWGMITFCAAILWVSLHDTTTRARLQVGVIGLITITLLGLSIVHGWTRWAQSDVTLDSLQQSMQYLQKIPFESLVTTPARILYRAAAPLRRTRSTSSVQTLAPRQELGTSVIRAGDSTV